MTHRSRWILVACLVLTIMLIPALSSGIGSDFWNQLFNINIGNKAANLVLQPSTLNYTILSGNSTTLSYNVTAAPPGNIELNVSQAVFGFGWCGTWVSTSLNDTNFTVAPTTSHPTSVYIDVLPDTNTYNCTGIVATNSTSYFDCTNETIPVCDESVQYANLTINLNVVRPPILFTNVSYPKFIAMGNNVSLNVTLTSLLNITGFVNMLTYPNSTTVIFEMNRTWTNQYGNQSAWSFFFNDTNSTFDFDMRLVATDLLNNTNTSFEWFQTYDPEPPNPVYFNGTLENLTGQPVANVIFKFYRPNSDVLIAQSAPTGVSNGSYTKAVYRRTYDLVVEDVAKPNLNSIRLYGVPIQNDTINSTKYDPITAFSTLNLSIYGGVPRTYAYPIYGYPTLTGFTINTNLTYAGSSLVFANYSNATFRYAYEIREERPWGGTNTSLNESNLALYRCTSWSYSNSTFSCASNWTRNTGVVDAYAKTLTVNISGFSAFATAAFFCGDGVCETAYGEQYYNCPDGKRDCPKPVGNETENNPPQPPGTPGSGGAGSGGAGGGGFPTAPPVTPTDQPDFAELPPMSVSANEIEVRLAPGEYVIQTLAITNNLDSDLTVRLSVDGRVWEYVQFERTRIVIKPHSTAQAQVKFFTSLTTIPGTYTGTITVDSDLAGKKEIPTRLIVEMPKEKLLDVKVDTITREVKPDEFARFQIGLFNLGQTKRVDVFVNYTVTDIATNQIVLFKQETMAIETTLSFVRSFQMPKDIKPGKYMIRIDAMYGANSATAVNSFDIVQSFWIFDMLWALFTSWMTYVVLFVILPGAYLGSRLYNLYLMERRAHERYISPVNYSLLPKAGPRAIKVGRIAETDITAYIDMDKLTTHMIAAGGTGSGKSVSIMVITEELLKRNVPVVVFDPTAQWTGFIKPQRDQRMLALFPAFGMRPEEARAFKGNLLEITDPETEIDIRKYMAKGEITIFSVSRMTPVMLDRFVRKTIEGIFAIPWDESPTLRLFIVYDEVHRLLPKFGGKGGYIALERGCREFRKWGIGLAMISQVLMDFRGAIRTNIGTEIQLRTKYDGDIKRVQTKYGANYAETLPKLSIGTGLTQNPEYNEGRPWFISFRPLLHSTFRLTDQELKQYSDFTKQITDISDEIANLKKAGKEVYDLELELNLARDKIKQGQLRMAETYLSSVSNKVADLKKKG